MTDGLGNAIIHIGAGKCGSSALQHSLSFSPLISGADGPYEYCAFGVNGRLIRGRDLKEAAERSPFGYTTCPMVPPIENTAAFRRAGRALSNLVQVGTRPILSNEGWIYSAEDFKREHLLGALNLRPRIFAFVRPPLEWLNSAWWQWGAWTGVSLERWIRNAHQRPDWHEHLRKWAEVPGVASVEAKVLGKDVANQFWTHIGAKPPYSTTRQNSALPEGILRFFQRNRAFRPGPHDSKIDFLLSRHLGNPAGTVPWVLTPELCKFAMDRLAEGIDKLKPFLSFEDARQLDEDPAWRDPEHYRQRKLVPAEDPGDIEMADDVIANLIRRVIPDAGSANG